MSDEVLSYFENRLLNELNRIATALEEMRDQAPTHEVVEAIGSHIESAAGSLDAIAKDASAIDRSLSYIEGKMGD